VRSRELHFPKKCRIALQIMARKDKKDGEGGGVGSGITMGSGV
jgi:hypothetical protein